MELGPQAGGIIGLIWLIIIIWAVIRTAQSSATPLVKAIWIVVLLALPLLGLVLWVIFGPK
ncbi:MAG: PLDc N-terminal domain-containing protein [Ectothiorhodospiraceae bacterium]|nr:PLDc N-terminal domain-containing protein [Ectothiorhodospiraceae bacterium]